MVGVKRGRYLGRVEFGSSLKVSWQGGLVMCSVGGNGWYGRRKERTVLELS